MLVIVTYVQHNMNVNLDIIVRTVYVHLVNLDITVTYLEPILRTVKVLVMLDIIVSQHLPHLPNISVGTHHNIVL